MKKNDVLKYLTRIDTDSEVFSEIYNLVRKRYWTFKDPDEYQNCARLLNEIAHKSDPDEVTIGTKVFVELLKMIREGQKSCLGNLEFENGDGYIFEIYSSHKQQAELKNILGKVDKSNIKFKANK